ncbi:hypothetical protein [Muribaculum gordoncarteri]|jgi:hypothetical protein|uniref:hypothetical protein n=2 Tax=Muribaculum TaxID=1918540 RepID=UPI00143D2555|nr:hypothetical protein [Muribaculum gordoncarteri]
MNVNIEELITINYELEGLLYLAMHRGDDTPKEVWSLISDKIKSLNEGISPAVEDDDVDTDDTPDNAVISCCDETDVTADEQPEIEEPENQEEELEEDTAESCQPQLTIIGESTEELPEHCNAEPEAPCSDIEQEPSTEPEPIAEPMPETTVEIETVEPEPEEEEEPELKEEPEPEEEQEEPEDEEIAMPQYDTTDTDNEEPIRLDEKLARENSRNLRKAFSLNDMFRFRRELFGNSATEMTDTLNLVEAMSSLSEANDYFYNDLEWDASNPEVQDFMDIIAKHFSGR